MRKYLSLLLIPFLAFQIGCEDDDDGGGGSSSSTNPLVGVYDMTSVYQRYNQVQYKHILLMLTEAQMTLP